MAGACGVTILEGLTSPWFKKRDLFIEKIWSEMCVIHLYIKGQTCIVEFTLHFDQLLVDIHPRFAYEDIPPECGMAVHPQIAF